MRNAYYQPRQLDRWRHEKSGQQSLITNVTRNDDGDIERIRAINHNDLTQLDMTFYGFEELIFGEYPARRVIELEGVELKEE